MSQSGSNLGKIRENKAKGLIMEKKENVLVPLRWGNVVDAETIYANQIFIYTAGSEYYLAFGEIKYDPRTGPEAPPEFVEIEPLVKIAATPEKIKEFANIIVGYLKSRGEWD